MTPELWQRLRPLYDAALDMTPEQRDHYVAEVCGSDLELKEALRELLDASDDTDDTLDEPLISFNANGLGKGRNFSPGELLVDRYRIVRLLGVGGMGEVYEAEDLRTQSVHIALKAILPHIAADPDLQQRFEREVLLAREVAHPNLCPIYGIEDRVPGLLIYTMKFLPGRTLAERLREKRPVSTEEGEEILRQTALGLSAIHTAGIVHRDIKTNNIMVDGVCPSLRLWITDFGLARAFETETTLTGKGKVAGTVGYIAPELYQFHPPSRASDLFAFGVVLHEVFTGQKPTPSPDNSFVTVSPRLCSPRVPLACVELITACLSSDPKRRCKAFDEALHTLDKNSAAPRPPVPFWTRRRFVGAGAAAACAAAGGAWWSWPELENLRQSPLPKKRFVALLNWPRTSDGQVVPMLTGVLGAIKSQLSRIEASDRDFFIITPEDVQEQGSRSATHLKEICDSLGANLVLAASSLPQPGAFHLLLRVLDTSGRQLREKALSAPPDEITSLPAKAARAAASLLSVNHYLKDNGQTDPGTKSTDAFTAFQSAEALMKQPNDSGLNGAIDKYKQAVDLDPQYAIAHAKLAEAYGRLYAVRRDPGALELARGNCERSLALDPNLVEGYLAQALVMEQSGDEQGALDQYPKALALDPSNPKTILWLAGLYVRLDRWADAEAAYHRVLNERPNSWVTYNDLGHALDEQGKFQQSIQAFQAATVAAPGSALAWGNLGAEHLEIGNFFKATDGLKKSLELNPNYAMAASNTSLALRYQGKYNDALHFALRAVELEPADDENWLELGECYSSLPNRKSEAKQAYVRAGEEAKRHLQTDPTNGPGWMLLALYDVKSGNPQNAASLITKAESLGAADMDSQLYKARTLELLGRREEALATFATCFQRGAGSLQVIQFPDMESLRKDPRYLSLVRSHPSAAETNRQPGVGKT